MQCDLCLLILIALLDVAALRAHIAASMLFYSQMRGELATLKFILGTASPNCVSCHYYSSLWSQSFHVCMTHSLCVGLRLCLSRLFIFRKSVGGDFTVYFSNMLNSSVLNGILLMKGGCDYSLIACGLFNL